MIPAHEHAPSPVEDRGAPQAEVEALLREIADDARRDPERFLDESRVPEGGE